MVEVSFSQADYKPGECVKALVYLQNVYSGHATGRISTVATSPVQITSSQTVDALCATVVDAHGSSDRSHGSKVIIDDNLGFAVEEHILLLHAQVLGQCTLKNILVKHENLVYSFGSHAKSRKSEKSWPWLDSTITPWHLDSVADMFGRKRSGTCESMPQCQPILAMVPEVMAVELKIQHLEIVPYSFEYLLPRRLPPTFSGEILQTSYVLRLTLQRADNSVREADFPFSISNDGIPSLTGYNLFNPAQVLSAKVHMDKSDEARRSRNEREEIRQQVHAQVDAKPKGDTFTDIRSRTAVGHTIPKAYHITKDGGTEEVCILRLHGTDIVAGRFIEGNLDFRAANVSCQRVSLRIEREEVVAESYMADVVDKTMPRSRAFCVQEHMSIDNAKVVQLRLLMPNDEVGTFATSPVGLHYFLVLQFWYRPLLTQTSGERSGHDIVYDHQDDFQGNTFECRIPIEVKPCERKDSTDAFLSRHC